jgi:hypothetical protein
MAAARAAGQPGATRFFPLDRIADASPWRQSIGTCLTGFVCLPLTNSSVTASLMTTALTGSDKVELNQNLPYCDRIPHCNAINQLYCLNSGNVHFTNYCCCNLLHKIETELR